jgi:hypothetical protein
MKYLKTFEEEFFNEFKYNKYSDPQVGDYFIFKNEIGNGIDEKLKNKIGRITEILNNTLIAYDFPDYIVPLGFKYIHMSFIDYFSKNKEDLEAIINQNKYNL